MQQPARRHLGPTGLAAAPRTRRLVTAVAVGTVLWPVTWWCREKPRDSFPLSHYPMFTRRRGTHLRVVHLRGRLADGSAVRLRSSLGATGGMNQERKTLRRAARRPERAARVLRRAARRVARSPAHADVVAVELVDSRVPLRSWEERRPLVGDPEVLLATRDVARDTEEGTKASQLDLARQLVTAEQGGAS